MEDRYLCVVLLVGQACWESSLGKDDDVADHTYESHNIAFGVMGVILEISSFVPKRSQKEIGWEAKVPRPLAGRWLFAR